MRDALKRTALEQRGAAALILGGVCAVLVGMGAGCVRMNPSFFSAEPAARNAAAIEAVERGDGRQVPEIIKMLESDDPATRVIAIQALERLTGERMGFEAYGAESERQAAVARWTAWWAGPAPDVFVPIPGTEVPTQVPAAAPAEVPTEVPVPVPAGEKVGGVGPGAEEMPR